MPVELIFVRELVLFEKLYQEASHTLNVCREVLKTSGFALGFQHFFKPPDCECKLIGGLNMILPSFQIFFCEKYHLSSFIKQ